MNRIAIVGVGLIGSSFALALRQAGFNGELVGVSSPRSVDAGIRVGAISRGVSLEEAAAWADLVYLSQPIDEILNTLIRLGPIAHPDCLITDAGSTKKVIIDAAGHHIQRATFLGGHPMAGKESRGAESADPKLFQGRPYVLTPYELTPKSMGGAVTVFRSWLERIGALVYVMEATLHDQTVAFTSHLPQLLSTALAATLANKDSELISHVFGPGLLDMTRLSLSAPEIWMSILRSNKEAIRAALSAYRLTLTELETKLDNDDLQALFSKASQFSASLRS